MKGDAEHYDKKGNLKIVKEELETEPEDKSSGNESESNAEDEDEEAGAEVTGEAEAIRHDGDEDDEAGAEVAGEAETIGPDSDSDIEIIEVVPKTPKEPPKIIDIEGMATVERVEDIQGNLKSEPKPEEDKPTPSTSAASNMVPANLGQIPGHIQIDWQAMAKLFNQHLKANQEAGPKTGNVPVKLVPDGQELVITAPKEEPKNDEPANGNKEQESNTEEFIRSLEDHLAASPSAPPNPAPQNPPNPDTDSRVEENPTTEPHRIFAMSGYESEVNPIREQMIREEIMQDSESENQGIEEVDSSSSSQEEITVDPSNFGEPKGAANDQSPQDEGEVNDQNPQDGEEEHNNNKEKPRVFLTLPTNRQAVANTANRQVLLHQVPVSFPVASNLMESMGPLTFINNALLSLTAPGELPSDVVADATPLNRVESHQNRTTVILTLDSEQRRDQILRRARKRYADTTIPHGKRYEYYFTA